MYITRKIRIPSFGFIYLFPNKEGPLLPGRLASSSKNRVSSPLAQRMNKLNQFSVC